MTRRASIIQIPRRRIICPTRRQLYEARRHRTPSRVNFECTSSFFVAYAPYASADNIGSSLSATDNLNLINVGTSSPTAVMLNLQVDRLKPKISIYLLQTQPITQRVLETIMTSIYPLARISTPTVSMQPLCTKTRFGGCYSGQNIRDWCQWGRYPTKWSST